MTFAPLYYRWANNDHRRDRLYGRPCRVVARGKVGSVLIEFTDGREPLRTLCSRRALTTAAPVALEPTLL